MLRFSKFLLEEFPQVTHVGSKEGRVTSHNFHVTHSSLDKPIQVHVFHARGDEEGGMDVYGNAANKLGPHLVRHAFHQLKQHLKTLAPELETLKGERVSGARQNLDYKHPSKEASINLRGKGV